MANDKLYRAVWKSIHPSALTPGMYILHTDDSGVEHEGILDGTPRKQPGKYSPWLAVIRTDLNPKTRIEQIFITNDVQVAEFHRVTP